MSNEPTITEMNEVIARFDGGKLISYCSIIDDDLKRKYWNIEGIIIAADKLEYHKSWNALMPIVKKIKTIKGIHPIAGMKAMSELNHGLLWIDLDRVYKGVFIFLTWYNQQTTTNEITS